MNTWGFRNSISTIWLKSSFWFRLNTMNATCMSRCWWIAGFLEIKLSLSIWCWRSWYMRGLCRGRSFCRQVMNFGSIVYFSIGWSFYLISQTVSLRLLLSNCNCSWTVLQSTRNVLFTLNMSNCVSISFIEWCSMKLRLSFHVLTASTTYSFKQRLEAGFSGVL